jgi:serine/threonine-protein kinase
MNGDDKHDESTDLDAEATRLFDTDVAGLNPNDSGPSMGQTLDPSQSTEASGERGRPPRFDDYELIEELGRGGMGVVYKAREQGTNRIVCIKMMLGGEYASKEALRRFQIETEAAAHLDHPHIVPIYRAGVVEGFPYFAMKFVDGKSMASIDRSHFLGHPREAVQLMVKVCRAIEFAHSRGILHRDLKPGNIMLDKQGEPHITDFGLAKKMDEDSGQTHTGLIMGTPDYMSPEQAIGAHAQVSVTSDVYSLGSILFDLITGQPPFRSATVVETLSRVTQEPARNPTTINQRVSKDLQTICLKCLEKAPQKRYRSAASLADELDRYLRGEPIQGRPVGSGEKLWRWGRRNPVLATMSGVLIVMLITAAVGSTLAAYQINKRRNEAVAARGEAETAQTIAEEQRTLALETLHKLVTEVEEKLRDRADLADVQSKILGIALDGLKKVSRTTENTGRADRTTGVAHQRMADILEHLGRTSESKEEHRYAIEIFESLYEADPRNDWAKWNAAISYDKLADGLVIIDTAAAAELYRRSLALRQQLADVSHADDLTSNQRKRALLISASKLGGLELQQGRPEAARQYFVKTLEQSEAMLQSDPTNNKFKSAVAGCCSLLGEVAFRAGDTKAAIDYRRRALTIRQELLAEDPTNVSTSMQVAGTMETIGDVRLMTGSNSEAHQRYQAATDLLQQLYAQDQDNAKLKGRLSTTLYKLAVSELRLDHDDDAKQAFEDCLALREELYEADPDDPDKQISLMLARARCGLHQAAVEIAEQLRSTSTGSAGSLFYLACGYALSAAAAADSDNEADHAAARQYARLAIDAIEEAIAAGYRDASSLKLDPDLEPIRQDPRFKKLLRQLNGDMPESNS